MKQIVLCCYCYSNEKLFNKYFNGFFLRKKGHRAPLLLWEAMDGQLKELGLALLPPPETKK